MGEIVLWARWLGWGEDEGSEAHYTLLMLLGTVKTGG